MNDVIGMVIEGLVRTNFGTTYPAFRLGTEFRILMLAVLTTGW
jgi:hypothetical protein